MSIAPNEGQVQGDDSIAARTADGQEVLIDFSVIYSVDPNQVIQLHIEWQDRYSSRPGPPARPRRLSAMPSLSSGLKKSTAANAMS